MAYIYGLVDPISHQLRYIGYTAKDPNIRAACHWKERKGNKTHKQKWLNKLWGKYQKKPEIFVLEEIEQEQWLEAECFWIDYFISIGSNLTNSSIGGQGRIAGTKLTEDHKNKISKGLLLASTEGRFDYKSAGNKRKGKPTWNKGKTFNISPEASERRKQSPLRFRNNFGSGKDHPRTTKLELVNPKGILQIIYGKSKFCKDQGMTSYSLNKLLMGEIENYKGWTKPIRVTMA